MRQAQAPFAIVALHGGGIEPGTSEIADAAASERHSFYAFEGLKPAGNADLHLTSTHFDEQLCLQLITQATVVLTLHGERSQEHDAGVFVGGLDEELGIRVDFVEALRSALVLTRP